MKIASVLALSALGCTYAQVDVCTEANLNNATADYCSCTSTTIAKNPIANIECKIGESSDIFYADANVTMFPCSKTAEFEVSLMADGKDYGTYDCVMGQTEKVEIPGLTLDVNVGGQKVAAQGYIDMSMKGNTEDFVAQIDLNFCATFWGVDLCGDDLSPSLPYNLITGELTTKGIC